MYKEIYNLIYLKNLPEQKVINYKYFFILLGVGYFSAMITGMISALILFINSYDQNNHLVVSQSQSEAVIISILSSIIAAPLIEEFTFRGIFTRTKWIWFLSILLQFRLVFLIFEQYFIGSQENIFIFGIILIFILFVKYSDVAINFTVNTTNFWIVLYTIVFAVMHLLNFTNLEINPLLYIFLIFPQLFIGIILGYIRITYGLRYSILMHACYNLIVLLPVLLVKQNNDILNVFSSFGVLSCFILSIFAVIQSLKIGKNIKV